MSSSVSGGGGELTMYLKHLTESVRFSSRPTAKATETYFETLIILLLLLVDDTQAKVDLVGLFEVRLHLHDLRESFLGVIKRSVAVVQYTDAIPQLWLLQFSFSGALIEIALSDNLLWGFEA
jgi:hypothetical protein